MSTVEYLADRAQAKREAAIEAEEARDELILQRAEELIKARGAAMAPMDVMAGLQSVMSGLAGMIGESLRKGDLDIVGIYIKSAIDSYIESDSEVMAVECIERIEREAASWEY
ncbi:hypothetical protein F0160_22530 [Paraburkholderia sp. JPY303]|uniref:hypothetical protein n=1 Tax=Paraburkholderia atlantica TaxID=2654982 RepID=UPI001590C1B0|nr:hypothetical protein [Paraburkholderia atlantica]NUY33264.1 hypothetical protein [Paraburkholderia atlantica]